MEALSELKYVNPPGFDLDFDLVVAFERCLDLRSPQRSRIPCRVLGYGEISTVLEIQIESLSGLAFKRMSIFETAQEVEEYLSLFQEYIRILEAEIMLCLPPQGYLVCESASHRPIFYIIQKQVPYYTLGNKAIDLLSPEQSSRLFLGILGELLRVWSYNRSHPACRVAIDGQVSNWAIEDLNPERPQFEPGTTLLYLDTSSPFVCLNGVEQLNPELFLRAAPSFMAWILRLLFLEEVMARYYDPCKVTIDLLANLYKEHRPELVQPMVETANSFFAGQASELGVPPILEEDVQKYYREDALIWSLYLSMRRFDRFLHQDILHQEYPYLLPGKIKR